MRGFEGFRRHVALVWDICRLWKIEEAPKTLCRCRVQGQRRSCVGKELAGHEVVRLQSSLNLFGSVWRLTGASCLRYLGGLGLRGIGCRV